MEVLGAGGGASRGEKGREEWEEGRAQVGRRGGPGGGESGVMVGLVAESLGVGEGASLREKGGRTGESGARWWGQELRCRILQRGLGRARLRAAGGGGQT